MSTKSLLGALLEAYSLERGVVAPVPEHRFHPVRRWRFDFAWPQQKVAFEVEGGEFVQGRHTRGAGYQKDCEKYNHAVLLGWRVFRLTRDQIRRGQLIPLLDLVFAEFFRGEVNEDLAG